MGRRIRDYVKYTVSELENYTKTEESCVKKIKNRMHLNLLPYALANIKKTILTEIETRKIGFFDPQLQGIILDVRNIKILGDESPINFSDANIHLDIETDCYVFQPRIGAVVRGIVKHISSRQIGVIIYRVFSASIRLDFGKNRALELNSEVEFRIKNFDIQHFMPFIEGELIAKNVGRSLQPEKDLGVIEILDSSSDSNNSCQQLKILEEQDLYKAKTNEEKGDPAADRTHLKTRKKITKPNKNEKKCETVNKNEELQSKTDALLSVKKEILDSYLPEKKCTKEEFSLERTEHSEDNIVAPRQANTPVSHNEMKKRKKHAKQHENMECALNSSQNCIEASQPTIKKEVIKCEDPTSCLNTLEEYHPSKKNGKFVEVENAILTTIKCETSSENEVKSSEKKKSRKKEKRKEGNDESHFQLSETSKKEIKIEDLDDHLIKKKRKKHT